MITTVPTLNAITPEAEALLAKLGYARDPNGQVIPLPATRKVGAVKDLEQKHVQEHTATRGKIFEQSLTAIIRWCGKDGWEFSHVRKMLLEMGASTIADTTVRIQLTAGKKGDARRGEVPTLTTHQSKILRSAGGKVS